MRDVVGDDLEHDRVAEVAAAASRASASVATSHSRTTGHARLGEEALGVVLVDAWRARPPAGIARHAAPARGARRVGGGRRLGPAREPIDRAEALPRAADQWRCRARGGTRDLLAAEDARALFVMK